MRSIRDALEGGDIERQAREALHAETGRLLSEYAAMLDGLGISQVPIYTQAPGWYMRRPPLALSAHLLPWEGLFEKGYIPRVTLAVNSEGEWSPVMSKLMSTNQGLAMAYWAWSYPRSANPDFPGAGWDGSPGWVPAGVPISASFAADIESGRLYPGIRVAGLLQRVTMRAQTPSEWIMPLAECLADYYRWHAEHPTAPLPTVPKR